MRVRAWVPVGSVEVHVAPVRASDVKVRVGVTMLAGLLQSAAMQCHESVTFFLFSGTGALSSVRK